MMLLLEIMVTWRRLVAVVNEDTYLVVGNDWDDTLLFL